MANSSTAATGTTNHWLLVTDIDDTLLGDDDPFLEFAEAASGCPSLSVVLNSSRPIASVRESLRHLPTSWRPRGLITAMGTEIHLDDRELADWQDRFANWDRTLIDRLMTELGAAAHRDEFQTDFKASYAVEPQAVALAEDRLLQAGLDLQFIASGASDFDVIPLRAGKGQATLEVAARLGVDADKRLIVAGDSGNDIAMFEVSQKAIAVGNARDELLRALDPQRSFRASLPRAAGILEGLQHWGVPIAS